MERLWSCLRGFGKMAKEMRPSHHVDILTDALIYHGTLQKEKLGKFKLLFVQVYCNLLAFLLLLQYERILAEESLHELATQ